MVQTLDTTDRVDTGSVRDSQEKEVYITYFSDGDQGILEHTSETGQFTITQGSNVRFRIRKGSKFSKNPSLLVNLPVQKSDWTPKLTEIESITDETTNKGISIGDIPLQNDYIYTMTQPKCVNQSNESLQNDQMWGIPIDKLEKIEPFEYSQKDQSKSQFLTFYEFRVSFDWSGSFFVQLQSQGEDGSMIISKPNFINVEPKMRLSQSERAIKCKELRICTVVSRCLGSMSRWVDCLTPVADLAYNAVHFTPIQVYGESKSHYSIADQDDVDPYFFQNQHDVIGNISSTHSQISTNENSESPIREISSSQRKLEEQKCEPPSQISEKEHRFEQLESTMSQIRNKLGLFGIMDIVLNHTANNSAWIQDHPEACYSTDLIPRLYPAYLLDKTLAEVSREFSQGNCNFCKSAPYLNNERELDQVIHEMSIRAHKLNLHEFFLGSVNQQAFLESMQGMKQDTLEGYVKDFKKKGWFQKDQLQLFKDEMIENVGHGPQRNQVQLKLPQAAIYLTYQSNQNVSQALEKAHQLMDQINRLWTETIKKWIGEAMQNCKGTINYFILQLKRNKISSKNHLLDPYFSELRDSKKSKVVHNGWIADHDIAIDFAEEQNFSFLRRKVNIWGDSIKLRYGKTPADSPFLWEHMSRYVARMAKIFDGFRLDNAHSTPLHVCQYLLQVARCHNPNLFVMAELFTGSAEYDTLFSSRLNINGMIREMQNRSDVQSVGAYFHELACRESVMGKLDEQFEFMQIDNLTDESQFYRILKPVKPSDIIYDMTHDNPTVLEKFGNRRLALPTIGLLGLADQIIASTWGYDQMLPENVSVTKEERLYPHQVDLVAKKWKTRSQKPKKDSILLTIAYQTANGAKCSSVKIAGEFTNWKPAIEMEHKGDTLWEQTLRVEPKDHGRKVQLKFVEDNCRWNVGNQLPRVKDSQGNENNYFMVGTQKNTVQNQSLKLKDIRLARRLLNLAHQECSENQAEIFMHSQSDDTILVFRQLPFDYSPDFDAYVTISRFCFAGCNEGSAQTLVDLPGELAEVVFIANGVDFYSKPTQVQKSQAKYIESPSADVWINSSLEPFARILDGENIPKSQIQFFNMPQAFTCLLKVKVSSQIKESVQNLDKIQKIPIKDLSEDLFENTCLTELNHLLFRCKDEELDISEGKRGPYGLPKSGQFVYAGLQSLVHIFDKLKVDVDMGHEFCDNIRQGNWLLEYTQKRIESELGKLGSGLAKTNQLLKSQFDLIKTLPVTFRPKYVCRIIVKLFDSAKFALLNKKMSMAKRLDQNSHPPLIEDEFVDAMKLAVVQMFGQVPSMEFGEFKESLCAGLPHFSTGYVRCWGRDTFISLKGLFLTTGLFKEARDTILFFAKVSRHGLIPNLHDQGNNTRFNARDATWFFLQAIQDYIKMVPDGYKILQERFSLTFPDLESFANNSCDNQITLEDLVVKILEDHSNGISFRERNAGTKIDAQMKDRGFDINIWCDFEETGFCFGGNEDNCGTWMDKMGSADCNKGIPATPRDGAPIELVALQYSALKFFANLHEKQQFRTDRVSKGTYLEWAKKMEQNFERCFYVAEIMEDQDTLKEFDIDMSLVNRKGIYKDTYRSSKRYTDYQLRPNLCIAMAEAPDLFNQTRAKRCLQIVEQALFPQGILGMKTLDPQDREYKGNYDNDDETRGHNYHQGPEWVWPVGFFLRSKLAFEGFERKVDAEFAILNRLLPHQKHITKDDQWHSLPELTNADGKMCHHSCPAQAWSISTILDAFNDLSKFDPQNQ